MSFLFLFLSCFAEEQSKPQKLGLPSCLENFKKVEPNLGIESVFENNFKAGTVVLITEHHEQVIQLEALSQAIELASKKNPELSFSAEWLPAISNEKINKLVNGQKWDSELWLSIIGDKDYIRPLHIQEYEIPIQKIWEINQNRKQPILIFGLAPNCSFQDKAREGVLGCLMDREDFMEKQVRENFPPSQKGGLLVSLGFRHAQLVTTDIDNRVPLGKRLDDYETISVLQNGFGEDGLSLCGGLFDQLNQEVILSLNEEGLSVLDTSCTSKDPYHKLVSLKDAYTYVWATPYEWKQGTHIDLDNLDSAALNKWSTFQNALMKQPSLGADVTVWEAWIEKNFEQIQPQKQEGFDCSKLDVVEK